MPSNYTKTGTDLDNILITQANKLAVPVEYRKGGTGSIWGTFGYAYHMGDTYTNTGYPDYTENYNTSPTVIGNTNGIFVELAVGQGHKLYIDYLNQLFVSGAKSSGGTTQFGEFAGVTIKEGNTFQIGTLTNWSKVGAGNQISYAIKTDGTLWSWGLNTNGQLGLNDITHRSSPVQVGALTNWSSIFGGDAHAASIKTDGTLWAWGLNTNGQLGLNDITHRSSPVQVGAGTTWVSIGVGAYHTLAIKTDGTLWSWGRNTNGQLGLGDRTHRSSPVQVGALTTWSKVSGFWTSSLAIKTDGTLWSWGDNTYGQLGLNGATPRSSPVQVGALTSWSSLSSGSNSVSAFAIKTDGTLWAWGYNNQFQLGLGDQVDRSSPVQVGTSNIWQSIGSSGLLVNGYGRNSVGIQKIDYS